MAQHKPKTDPKFNLNRICFGWGLNFRPESRQQSPKWPNIERGPRGEKGHQRATRARPKSTQFEAQLRTLFTPRTRFKGNFVY